MLETHPIRENALTTMFMDTSIIFIKILTRENEKKKSHEFVTSERSMKINKDNQILLSKLVEIQNGKWSKMPKAHTPSVSNISHSKHIL